MEKQKTIGNNAQTGQNTNALMPKLYVKGIFTSAQEKAIDAVAASLLKKYPSATLSAHDSKGGVEIRITTPNYGPPYIGYHDKEYGEPRKIADAAHAALAAAGVSHAGVLVPYCQPVQDSGQWVFSSLCQIDVK